MSLIHINQIKTYLTNVYEDSIDMTDIKSQKKLENFFLPRALAAFVIQNLAQVESDLASRTVTDGGDDNGLDAIFYEEREKILYLVQSKWIHSGKGEPSNGDVKKFIAGVKDLINLNFDRFNEKINELKPILIEALQDPYVKVVISLAYTGINELAKPSARDVQDFIDEVNDVGDTLRVEVLNQAKLHSFLTTGVKGEPIDIDIGVKSWGKILEPSLAYYGQVNAQEIVDWWNAYNNKLFIKNLRGVLGDTDVNNDIKDTLVNRPEYFWYFNNGITIVASKVIKTLPGGADNDNGVFHCKDISIVNGAQTVSTIGKSGSIISGNLKKVFIPIRIISLENSPEYFGASVTKTNNLQNRIENRDFVSLDAEQKRIQIELKIDGIDYHISRAENVTKGENSVDLIESTVSLACASGNISIVVTLKREIGKLWEDIRKPPYTKIFNRGVTGTFLYRCVQIQRIIERRINTLSTTKITDSRGTGIAIHGNRIISALIFLSLDITKLKDPEYDFKNEISAELINGKVDHYIKHLLVVVDELYPNSVIQTLFKNSTKCKPIFDKCKLGKSTEQNHGQKELSLWN